MPACFVNLNPDRFFLLLIKNTWVISILYWKSPYNKVILSVYYLFYPRIILKLTHKKQ